MNVNREGSNQAKVRHVSGLDSAALRLQSLLKNAPYSRTQLLSTKILVLGPWINWQRQLEARLIVDDS